MVHAEAKYGRHAEKGIYQAIRLAKGLGAPVVYMMENGEGWYPDTALADKVCFSTAGQHSFEIEGPEIIVTGGMYRACLTEAVQIAVLSYFEKHKGVFSVHMPMDAIVAFNGGSGPTPLQLQGWNTEWLWNSIESSVRYYERNGIVAKAYLDRVELHPTASGNEAPADTVQLLFWTSVERFKTIQFPASPLVLD